MLFAKARRIASAAWCRAPSSYPHYYRSDQYPNLVSCVTHTAEGSSRRSCSKLYFPDDLLRVDAHTHNDFTPVFQPQERFRETSKKYAMNKIRAALYGLATGVLLFGFFVSAAAYFAVEESFVPVASLMVFFLPGFGRLSKT